jgi:hypothetical protein
MAEKQIKDLTLLETKGLILDHLDNISISQQMITALRQQLTVLAGQNGNIGKVGKAHEKKELVKK